MFNIPNYVTTFDVKRMTDKELSIAIRAYKMEKTINKRDIVSLGNISLGNIATLEYLLRVIKHCNNMIAELRTELKRRHVASATDTVA